MAAVLKNVCFHVLDDIVYKYNNTVHRTIKMKPIDVISDPYAKYNEDSNKKIPNLKFQIILGYQKEKHFLLNDIFGTGQKKFLLLAKLTIQLRGLIILAT